MEIKEYWVYIVQCSDGTLYTGIALDIAKRLQEHNGVFFAGAKYTSSRRPVHLVYKKKYNNRADASREEIRIKRLTKKAKMILIQENIDTL